MAVAFDPAQGLVIIPDECRECGTPLYDTGCSAPGCDGRYCLRCSTGCDREIAPEDGLCAQAAANESAEDALARINAERVAFGLPPYDADGNRIENTTEEQA